MQVKYTVSMGLVGCKRSEVVEVEDDLTDEELDEFYQQWLGENVDGGWERLD